MNWEKLRQEADLNHEIYIGMLQGLAQQVGGVTQLAKRMGMHPAQLSPYLNRDNPPPGPKTAERIARTVPLEPEERELLRERMYLAHKRRLEQSGWIKYWIRELTFGDLLQEFKRFHREAVATSEPVVAMAHYRSIRDMGQGLIGQLRPGSDKLAIVEIYGFLQHIESILNHPLAALDYAMRARHIMLALDRRDFSWDHQRFDRLVVNSCRIVSVAYHNLRLFYESGSSLDLAKRQPGVKIEPEYWIPHLNRGLINALAGQPRFSIRVVEDLGREIKDRRPPVFLHTARALATAFIRYGNLAKAEEMLLPQLPVLDQFYPGDLLTQAMFLKTCAQLRFRQGDTVEGNYFVGRALKIDHDAGFTHQLQEIQQEFGPAINPILEELGIRSTTATI